ncbi:hypothetical protein [Gloeothece verrucosa]|uniref:SPOR domain-containing protein n=1 Tax=Gloeothece verrucosa (strain PCC 7822) TaxID=497965 RepID=E0UGL1_GLOV7|nr:hypothetical protein [Gloeothece verrucosa]ADN13220.1 hypothetical protein Cyan7822_1215 [Gloeothece verrucosa PCC 7822]
MIKIRLFSLSGKFSGQLSQFLLIFSGLTGWNITYCAMSIAQTSPLLLSELPPPPSMTPIDETSSSEQGETITTIPYFESTPTPPPSQSVQQEYNFQAPQPYYSTPANAGDKLVEFYRVEVMVQKAISNDESLLSQVRQIEPFAYLQTNNEAIYAGLFTEQGEAQKRVQQLMSQGLAAQIVPVNYSVSASFIPVQR